MRFLKNCPLLLLTFLIVASCNTIPERGHKMADVKGTNAFGSYEGSYEGDFGGAGNIRITLLHVDDSKANGYSLHKGLQRDMSGTVMEDKDGYNFMLKEPGDNPYDGTFDFVIDRSGSTLKGTWKPLNNKDLKQTSFTLEKVK